jgi:succinoglycan biosynthesis protein ExoA
VTAARRSGDPAPAVTVVVPARNEAATIGATLDSLVAQRWTDWEALVVDGDSTDGTAAVVLDYATRDPRISLLRNPARRIPSALNVALAEARGRWLVRLDAHSTIDDRYVETAVTLLEEGSWGGVGGRKDAVASTAFGRAVGAALCSRFGVGNSLYHYVDTPTVTDHVPFGAYPVGLCRELGGWDETITTNEDYEFDYRIRAAGYGLLIDPRLRIEWRCRESLSALAGQYLRYGRGKAAVVRKHPRSMQPRHVAAPLLVATVAGAVLGVRRSRGPLAAVAGGYGAAVAAATAATAPHVDHAARRHLPAVFAAMHLSWGTGFWIGLLLDRRPGRVARDAQLVAVRAGHGGHEAEQEAEERRQVELVQDGLDHALCEEPGEDRG